MRGLRLGLGLAAGAVAVPAWAQPATTYPPGAVVQPLPRDDGADLRRHLTALAANPRSLDALIGAGRAAVNAGDGEAALSFFDRARAIAPGNPRVQAGMGSALSLIGQAQAALGMFTQATANGAPEPEVAGDRGLAYDLIGDTARAQQDYLRALRHREDPDVRRRLALSLAISGEQAAALRLLDPQLRQNDRSAWRAQAFVLAMTGDAAGANRTAQSMMAPGAAPAMAPFLARLASLSPGQKAHAVHLGRFPTGPVNSAPGFKPPADPVALAWAMGGQVPVRSNPVQVASVAARPPAISARPTNNAATTNAARPNAANVPAARTPARTSRSSSSSQPSPADIRRYNSGYRPAARTPERQDVIDAPRQASTAPVPMTPPPPPPPAAQAEPAPARFADNPIRPPEATPVTGAPAQTTGLVATAVPAPPALSANSSPSIAEPVSPGFSITALGNSASAVPVDSRPAESGLRTVELPAASVPGPVASPSAAAASEPAPPPAANPAAGAPRSGLADIAALVNALPVESAGRSAGSSPAPATERSRAAATRRAQKPAVTHPARVWVQIATAADKSSLPREFTRLKGMAPDQLGRRTAYSAPLRATNRLLVGPFDDSREAQAFVNQLAKAEISAFAWTSGEGQEIERLPTR